MEKLERNTYWEIDIQKIEELIEKHFSIELDLINELELNNRTKYTNQLDLSKDSYQELNSVLISYCLTDSETSIDRIDQALWCLIMKDVIPEGNYLVSIYW